MKARNDYKSAYSYFRLCVKNADNLTFRLTAPATSASVARLDCAWQCTYARYGYVLALRVANGYRDEHGIAVTPRQRWHASTNWNPSGAKSAYAEIPALFGTV